tara:strand:- start:142 stop:1314 length:1173 start_codon:yes stop_codon:yes gene_type:complete
VFGEKKSFNSNDRDKNMEDVWNAIQDVKMPDKKSLLDIIRSQRKSVLKDTILSFITPRENKISIGTATITLKRKEWKDEEDFIVWMTKGAGSESDKKTANQARKLAELLMKIDNQIDAIEGSWNEYKTDVPFDRFFSYLMSKQRKEMVNWLQDFTTSIKNDKYNIDNPIQEEKRPVLDAEEQPVLDAKGKEKYENVRGKIQVEQIMTDKDGKIVRDKKGKQRTKLVDYEPVYDNHEKLIELVSTLRKLLGNSKITEGLNVGQFFLQEGKREDLILEELQKDVEDALKGKGNWQTYKDEKTGESTEFRMTTNKYVPIIKYTSNAPKKMVIDTKLDGISSREFKRGRFSEPRVRATKQQKKDRASKADKDDADELQLVYNEYMALKELIGSV